VQHPILPAELAAIHAMKGDVDQSVEWMQRAYDLGWREYRLIKIDPLLASVVRTPRYESILNRMEMDVRQKAAQSQEVKLLFEETVPSLPAPPPPAR
jgi:hypothetical protein